MAKARNDRNYDASMNNFDNAQILDNETPMPLPPPNTNLKKKNYMKITVPTLVAETNIQVKLIYNELIKALQWTTNYDNLVMNQ
ncbi:unnamed protein product [Rotaria socialis]|uniref:Uncharacterized protein n=1 Tax=Rotaria socialis TaxID=392032 RepID=A0A818GZQ1_9BILA|nr:unnamed protein product [Rotaria socialis]CAF3339143.1 unnamed protein product [Rotaria socialis]CAF3371084.1 unnamed protein product [Rotaria socialis]CAF3498961.1 unnamed protein product [Rotaria socialis]